MKNLKIPVAFIVTFLHFLTSCSAASKFSFTFTKLHEAATLPCYEQCSGSVTWSHKDDVLAWCDQQSCRSTEGFQIFHDQYLKGNLSLTITEADFSKRMWYTCRCKDEAVCDVSLRIQPFSYPVHVQAGQSLILDLPVPDDVEVIFNRTEDGGSNTFKLCKIEGRKAHCESLYEKRVSLGSTLQLKEVKDLDGGVYILRDTKNDEVIGMYTVTVDETRPVSSDDKGTLPGQDGSVAIVVAAVFGALLVIAILVILVVGVKYHQLQKCLRRLENQPQIPQSQPQQGEEQQEEQPVERQQMEDRPEVPVRTPVMETDDGQGIFELMKLLDDPENEADTSGAETDPLLKVDSPVTPQTSSTDEPPLSHPVPDSCSSNTQNRVF